MGNVNKQREGNKMLIKSLGETVEIKIAVTEMKSAFWWVHQLTGHREEYNQWAERQVDRNFLNWNSKEKKNNKNRTSMN